MSCLTRMARGGEMRTTACKPSVDQKMGKLRKKSDLDGIQRNMTSSRVSSFFTKRRVVFENLPSQYKEKDVRSLLKGFDVHSVYVEKRKAYVAVKGDSTAGDVVDRLDGKQVERKAISVRPADADALLFVGNIPEEYEESDLENLFSSYGDICRVLVIRSMLSGRSKRYGIIEYAIQPQALAAKKALAMKTLRDRTLRVDCFDSQFEQISDLHSCTLFVDQIAKGYKNNSKLRELFANYGNVTFCQIALSSNSGAPRGFAFVDMATWREAEVAQEKCNSAELGGALIRVSFGMPGRPGSAILQPRPFPNKPVSTAKNVTSSQLTARLQLSGLIPNHSMTTPLTTPSLSMSRESLSSSSGSDKSEIKIGITSDTRTPSISSTSASGVCSMTSGYLSEDPMSVPLQPLNDTSRGSQVNKPSCSLCRQCGQKVSRNGLRKRSLSERQDDSENDVYDKPFIYQHQQGIQYIHPAKRLKS